MFIIIMPPPRLFTRHYAAKHTITQTRTSPALPFNIIATFVIHYLHLPRLPARCHAPMPSPKHVRRRVMFDTILSAAQTFYAHYRPRAQPAPRVATSRAHCYYASRAPPDDACRAADADDMRVPQRRASAQTRCGRGCHGARAIRCCCAASAAASDCRNIAACRCRAV